MDLYVNSKGYLPSQGYKWSKFDKNSQSVTQLPTDLQQFDSSDCEMILAKTEESLVLLIKYISGDRKDFHKRSIHSHILFTERKGSLEYNEYFFLNAFAWILENESLFTEIINSAIQKDPNGSLGYNVDYTIIEDNFLKKIDNRLSQRNTHISQMIDVDNEENRHKLIQILREGSFPTSDGYIAIITSLLDQKEISELEPWLALTKRNSVSSPRNFGYLNPYFITFVVGVILVTALIVMLKLS